MNLKRRRQEAAEDDVVSISKSRIIKEQQEEIIKLRRRIVEISETMDEVLECAGNLRDEMERLREVINRR